jgi:hypothetical protein
MNKTWATLTQVRFNDKKLSLATLLLPACILTIFMTSAQATYQYTYTGNTFNTSSFTPSWDGDINNMSCYTQFREEYVTVHFTSPTLLSGGISLPTNLSFTMSTNDVNDSENYNDLTYPYNYPYPPNFPPPDFYLPPTYIGNFKILTVSSYSLPTEWDISIYNNYYNGHDTVENNIRTSTNQDSTSGSFSRFEFHDGQIDNTLVKWTVSEVPEPSTYVLLVLGLVLITISVKHNNRNCLR